MREVKVIDSSNWNIFQKIAYKLDRTLITEPARRKLRSQSSKLLPSPNADLSVPFSVHTLTCARDFEMGIWSAKSFNLYVGKALPWVFHEDGSLSEDQIKLLKKEFPGCRVIPYAESIQYARDNFSNKPLILEYREKLKLMLKLLDIAAFTRGERILFVDTDVMFFDKPQLLTDLVNDPAGANSFNKDMMYAYVFEEPLLGPLLNGNFLPYINSGLFVIDKSIFDFDKVEYWLDKMPMDQPYIIHRLEQTLIAMSAMDSSKGVSHLPTEYDVAAVKDVSKSICKHYVGKFRYGFELEGLRYALKHQSFIENWNAFAKNG